MGKYGRPAPEGCRGHFAQRHPKGAARRALPVQTPKEYQKNRWVRKLAFIPGGSNNSIKRNRPHQTASAGSLSTCLARSRRTHVRCHQIRVHRAVTSMVHSDHLCVCMVSLCLLLQACQRTMTMTMNCLISFWTCPVSFRSRNRTCSWIIAVIRDQFAVITSPALLLHVSCDC